MQVLNVPDSLLSCNQQRQNTGEFEAWVPTMESRSQALAFLVNQLNKNIALPQHIDLSICVGQRPINNCRILSEQSSYWAHALVDSSQRIQMRQKSSQRRCLHCLCIMPTNWTFIYNTKLSKLRAHHTLDDSWHTGCSWKTYHNNSCNLPEINQYHYN